MVENYGPLIPLYGSVIKGLYINDVQDKRKNVRDTIKLRKRMEGALHLEQIFIIIYFNCQPWIQAE